MKGMNNIFFAQSARLDYDEDDPLNGEEKKTFPAHASLQI